MNRPPRYQRKAWRRKSPPSAMSLSRKDNFFLSAITVVIFFTAILGMHFLSKWKSEWVRKESLKAMQVKYSLTEAQLSTIREIETRYHGTGSLFTRPSHTFEEEAAHRLAISRIMSSEAATRFLAEESTADSLSHKH